MDEPGLYPIVPKRSSWFLDKHRPKPRLKITRQQLPLAPAFAATAHAAQGQTLVAAIPDLQIGSGTSPIASYVAMTRVKTRNDLLIFRPFSHELFTRGTLEGAELLLRVLRGEEIDWQAIEEKHTPKGYCTGCGFVQFKESFPPSQFSRKDDRRFCSGCVKAKKKAGTPYECANCLLWKAGAAFSKNVEYVRADRRVCSDCEERRECKACGVAKIQADFTAKEW